MNKSWQDTVIIAGELTFVAYFVYMCVYAQKKDKVDRGRGGVGMPPTCAFIAFGLAAVVTGLGYYICSYAVTLPEESARYAVAIGGYSLAVAIGAFFAHLSVVQLIKK